MISTLSVILLRARIIRDLDSINDKQLLRQMLGYMQIIKRTPYKIASNREAVLSFAGTLTYAEAANLCHTLSQEFG